MSKNSDPDRILEQYEKFPYPSLPDDGKTYSELANLMQLFELDCGYSLVDRKILDVGTGTGLRLLELARTFPKNDYLGVDYSVSSINYANQAKESYNDDVVRFQNVNAAQLNSETFGKYDLVFCMGVLHHLQDPGALLSILSGLLSDDGALIFYVYGEYGSHERMRRKRILSHLHGDDDIGVKIATAKELGLTDFPYGWELRNQRDMDAMIVDAYINQYEVLYTLEKIDAMIPRDGYQAWAPYGFALEKRGILVESRLSAKSRLPLQRTTPRKFLESPDLEAVYEALPKHRQLLLLEDWYGPSGYTVFLHKGGFGKQLESPDRLSANTWV